MRKASVYGAALAHILIAAMCAAGFSASSFAQSQTQTQSPNSGSSDLGLVYSSANADAKSVIGIFNGISSSDWMSSGRTVTLTLRDGATGVVVGQWTSPSLKAGVAKQFAIADIESGLAPGTPKPATYAITAQAAQAGMAVQHLVLRNGILGNMSECSTGIATHGKALINVRTSLSAGTVPSTVVITNTGTKSSGLKIELYDADAGYFMGSFSSPVIPAGSHVMMSVAAMEAAAGLRVNRFTTGYVVRFGRSFDGGYNFVGFLQNLVSNGQTGVITDLTAYCPIGGPETAYPSTDGSMRTGPLFSSANSTGQSSLQFANTGTAAGTVTLTLQNAGTGATYGTWTSSSIPAGAAREYSIADIESAAALPTDKPSFYALKIQSTFAGEIQHTVRAKSDATLSDLSTCDFGTGAALSRLNGMHSSSAGSPSTVVITNTGAASASAALALYDANTGAKLGTATTPQVPAGGHIAVSVSDLEAAAQVSPTAAQTRYVVRTDGAFSGFLQHLVTNTATGAVSDITLACKLQLPPMQNNGQNQPPIGATLADVPPNVDLKNLPPGIDLSRVSQELRDYIASLVGGN